MERFSYILLFFEEDILSTLNSKYIKKQKTPPSGAVDNPSTSLGASFKKLF